LADAEDVLAPALFRGGHLACEAGGVLLPAGNITLNCTAGGASSPMTEKDIQPEKQGFLYVTNLFVRHGEFKLIYFRVNNFITEMRKRK